MADCFSQLQVSLRLSQSKHFFFIINQRMSAFFDVYNADGSWRGLFLRSECHGNPELIHKSVHVVVFDSTCRKILLQKRSMSKDIQPGKWDTAVGGHVDYGETIVEALRREVREEIGLTDFVPEKMCHYLYDSEREREMVYVYRAVYDGEVCPSEETDGGRFWSIEELRESLGKGILTPNFELEAVKVGLL